MDEIPKPFHMTITIHNFETKIKDAGHWEIEH